MHQGRKERSDVGELLHLQVLEVGGERLEVSGDVLRLLHGRHHVPVHRLEGGVVGAVCEEEDAGHLDGGVALHLLEQGLEVDALGRPEVELCHWTGRLKQTTV